MDRMTDAHAASLIDRIEGLTDALEDSNKSQRRLKVITAVLFGLVVVVAFVVLEQRSDGQDLEAVGDCLAGYNAAQSQSAPKIREASSDRDVALEVYFDARADYDAAWQVIIARSLDTEDPPSERESRALILDLQEAVTELAAADEEREAVQEAYDQAREDNPVPNLADYCEV